MEDIITVSVESSWLPPYRLEYDGKYLTLYGRDKGFPLPFYGGNGPTQYDEMVLMPVVIEKTNIGADIISFNDREIKINIVET